MALGLNSAQADETPSISGDGRYLAFASQRSGNGDIYVYDREISSFVDLPNLNSSEVERTPTLSADGQWLAFTTIALGPDLPGGAQQSEDVRIYNMGTKTLLPLSKGIRGINTGFDEQAPMLHPARQRLTFHSNRRNPEMGLYNRDIFVVDLLTQVPLAVPGLNSDFDEVTPHLSDNGEFVVFQSRRPGGEGNADIYLYRFQVASTTPTEIGQSEEIMLTKTGDGLLTAPVSINEQILNLLVDTTLNALIIFRDAKVNLEDSGQTFSLPLGQGNITGTLATGNITLGKHQTVNMRVILAERQACAEVLGLTLAGADGILGLASHPLDGQQIPGGNAEPQPMLPAPPRGNVEPPIPDVPLQVLKPAINIMELNFDVNGTAGMTFGKMPLLGNISRSVTHHTGIPGERNPQNPSQAHTDMRIPFIAMSYDATGNSVETFGMSLSYREPGEMAQAIAGTLLQDRVILDAQVATALGYDSATQSWPTAKQISLSLILFGSDTLLPIVERVSVDKIQVADLSKTDHSAIIGMNYWHRYVLGVDLNSNGVNGVLFIVERQNTLQVTTVPEQMNEHLISLPGLNSMGDELHGDLSDDVQTIVFQSNRSGEEDIYVWRANQGLLDLPELNSPQADLQPSLSADGNLVVFTSLRNGQPDIFLYDQTRRAFVELPGLNTEFPEEHPRLSADGTVLAYTSRRMNEHRGSADTYFYNLTTLQSRHIASGWLNTDADELKPGLNADGSLVVFQGMDRDDGNGASDVYLFNLLKNKVVELPLLNSRFLEGDATLSSDSDFLAFSSNRYDPSMLHLGSDILLMELSAGEFLALPGLNSDYEEGGATLTPNAEYILFHSKRAGSIGGYDLYLYHRDIEDTTEYVTTETFNEDGYATDLQGNPLANALVQATDNAGNVVGTATTDATGNFVIAIPVGAKLPVTYTTENGKVVTDNIGDDTYVPDFEAGNLKFTQVWVEDTLQAGMPTKIWFDVETATPKYNTFVKIYLVKLPSGRVDDLQLDGGDFKADYTLTALNIEKLGHAGVGEAMTQTQGQDIVTNITYLSEDNRKAHVEHSFIVPAEVANGTYAAVFSIGRFDYHPEDDALQSEDIADKEDNFMAAPASVIIGQPDKPNLRILSAKLNSNSFELPQNRPTKDSTPFHSELTLNMEVESMAQDTTLPVDITFALEVAGQRYPLSFALSQGKRPSKQTTKTYSVTCREETREGYPQGERCASLFRQEQQGYTYKLYIDEAAYDALATQTTDTTVNLVIELDPKQTVTEWENNTADNVKTLPVMFLAPVKERSSQRSTRGLTNTPNTYSNTFFDLSDEDSYGNSDFGTGYTFNAGLTYAEGTYNSTSYPYAASFDGTGNRVYVKIFGAEIDMLSVDAGVDVNGDKIICSWLEYDVDFLELDGYYGYYHVDGIDPSASSCDPSGNGTNTSEAAQEYEIWSSQDDDGNEQYTVSKSKDYEKTFTIGGIPITVAAGASGELGIHGTVTIDTTNTLGVEIGPYLELTGYAEGGVGVTGFNAGIGIELLILGIDLPFTAKLQVLPSYPLAIFTFEAPLIISTLDGELYLYAKVLFDKYTYTILDWTGYEWEIPLIDPVYLTWAEANQFVGQINGTTDVTAALDYDWGSTSVFTAWWEGDFDFDAGTYTFTADVDDYLEVQLDSDGDGDYDSTLFGMDQGEAIDHAGSHDGTPNNTPTWLTSDALSSATVPGSIEFNGTNESVQATDASAVIANKSTLTLSAWVYPTANSNPSGEHQGIVGFRNEDNADFYLLQKKNSTDIEARFRNSSDTLYEVLWTGVTLNQWQHLALTYDGSNLKLYHNGVLKGTISASGTITNTTEDFWMGKVINTDNGNNYYFDGKLDEVQLWTKAMTASEIQASMYTQLAGNESNLVAYYRFDAPSYQYSGTATYDVDVAEDNTLGLRADYENTLTFAEVSLSWSKLNSFAVSYYDSTDFSGDASWTTIEDDLNHDGSRALGSV